MKHMRKRVVIFTPYHRSIYCRVFSFVHLSSKNCNTVGYRFAYRITLRECCRSQTSVCAKILTERCRDATRPVASRHLPCLLDHTRFGREKPPLPNSKTSAKIRRISRTVRRIDSSFRGRCYEMDPCSFESKGESERTSERSKKERERRGKT